jgi:hypothetical protein
MSIPQALLRDEIPRNEAYREVRRSDLRSENLTGRGMRVTQQMGVFRQPQQLIALLLSLTRAGYIHPVHNPS